MEPGANEKGVDIYSNLLDCPVGGGGGGGGGGVGGFFFSIFFYFPSPPPPPPPHRAKATQFDVKMLDLGIEY